MNLQQYLHKYPLKRASYSRKDVQKLRIHAFQKAVETPGTTSAKQRKYYWSVIIKILRLDLGYSRDEMHQELGELFRQYEAHGRMFIKSIMQYSTADMEGYMSDVRRFAAMELNIYVPRPNETEFNYEIKEKGNDRSGVSNPERQTVGQ